MDKVYNKFINELYIKEFNYILIVSTVKADESPTVVDAGAFTDTPTTVYDGGEF